MFPKKRNLPSEIRTERARLGVASGSNGGQSRLHAKSDQGHAQRHDLGGNTCRFRLYRFWGACALATCREHLCSGLRGMAVCRWSQIPGTAGICGRLSFCGGVFQPQTLVAMGLARPPHLDTLEIARDWRRPPKRSIAEYSRIPKVGGRNGALARNGIESCGRIVARICGVFTNTRSSAATSESASGDLPRSRPKKKEHVGNPRSDAGSTC